MEKPADKKLEDMLLTLETLEDVNKRLRPFNREYASVPEHLGWLYVEEDVGLTLAESNYRAALIKIGADGAFSCRVSSYNKGQAYGGTHPEHIIIYGMPMKLAPKDAEQK